MPLTSLVPFCRCRSGAPNDEAYEAGFLRPFFQETVTSVFNRILSTGEVPSLRHPSFMPQGTLHLYLFCCLRSSLTHLLTPSLNAETHNMSQMQHLEALQLVVVFSRMW